MGQILVIVHLLQVMARLSPAMVLCILCTGRVMAYLSPVMARLLLVMVPHLLLDI